MYSYEDKVKDMLEYQSASLSMRALTLAKHMSAYRSCIEMQRLLSSNALDVTLLSKAFSQLPHLETLHVNIWDTRIGSAELIHAFGTFMAEDLLNYDCRYTLPVLIKALAASVIEIKLFELDSDEGSYNSISCSAGYYLTAASPIRPRLAMLMDEYSCPVRISTRALSETFCAENMHICQDALHNLRELTIGEIRVELDLPSEVSNAVTALRNLMQCAWGLEIVSLKRLWSPYFTYLPKPTLDSVMPHTFL